MSTATISPVTDLRPIILTFFFLKTLERILDNHIRSNRFPASVSSAQHEYDKGRPPETDFSSSLEGEHAY